MFTANAGMEPKTIVMNEDLFDKYSEFMKSNYPYLEIQRSLENNTDYQIVLKGI